MSLPPHGYQPFAPGLLRPEWHLPPGVHAMVSTREGGASLAPWASFNLGSHVGDDARAAAATAVPGILAGDDEMEREFLAHCVATHDSLAFMLARRALMKAGHPLGTGWDKAMDAIGQGAMA